jgi:divalent metal cation (Fe/Co/Zn/Cd) transporter
LRTSSRGLQALAVAIALSAAVAAAKIYGGLEYGSLAVLVDGLTCLANLVAGLFVLQMLWFAEKPPDIDHPYGHRRFQYTGILATILIYSFVAGYALSLPLERAEVEYTVRPESALYALLGGVFYGGTIVVARRAGIAGRSYAGFTASEMLESMLSVVAALGGAFVSSIIDVAGGIIIVSYVVVEILSWARQLHIVITDWASPQVVTEIKRIFEERGLKVESVRLRLKEHGRYIGEVIIVRPDNIPYDVTELLAEEAAMTANQLYNAELTVRVLPREARGIKDSA